MDDAVYIIHKKRSGERIEDGGTANTVILGQIQVILDTIDNLGFSQHMAVMLMVFQAVDIRFYCHARRLLMKIIAGIPLTS